MKEKIDLEEQDLMTSKKLDEIDENIKQLEVEGIQNILKYFDRIHDKLFTFNNILIGGYFALSQIYDSFSIYEILIPLINLGILIFIEYQMMEKSRFEADIKNKTSREIENYGTSINKTNLYSLLTILATTIVAVIFIYNVFTLQKANSLKKTLVEMNEKRSDSVHKIVKEEDLDEKARKNDIETKLNQHEKIVNSKNLNAIADTITNWQLYKDSTLLFKSNMSNSNRFTAKIKISDNYEYLILNFFYDFNNKIINRRIDLVYEDNIIASFMDENRSHSPFRISKREIDKIISGNVGKKIYMNYTDQIDKKGMTLGILKFTNE